mgnify:CR=1 FL=1
MTPIEDTFDSLTRTRDEIVDALRTEQHAGANLARQDVWSLLKKYGCKNPDEYELLRELCEKRLSKILDHLQASLWSGAFPTDVPANMTDRESAIYMQMNAAIGELLEEFKDHIKKEFKR